MANIAAYPTLQMEKLKYREVLLLLMFVFFLLNITALKCKAKTQTQTVWLQITSQ